MLKKKDMIWTSWTTVDRWLFGLGIVLLLVAIIVPIVFATLPKDHEETLSVDDNRFDAVVSETFDRTPLVLDSTQHRLGFLSTGGGDAEVSDAAVFHILQNDVTTGEALKVGYRLVLYINNAPHTPSSYASLPYTGNGTYVTSLVPNEAIAFAVNVSFHRFAVARQTSLSLAYDLFYWNGTSLSLQHTYEWFYSSLPRGTMTPVCEFTNNPYELLMTFETQVKGQGVYVKDVRSQDWIDTDLRLTDLPYDARILMIEGRTGFISWHVATATLSLWTRQASGFTLIQAREFGEEAWATRLLHPVRADRHRVVLALSGREHDDTTIIFDRSTWDVLHTSLATDITQSYFVKPLLGGYLFQRTTRTPAESSYTFMSSYHFGRWKDDHTVVLEKKIGDDTTIEAEIIAFAERPNAFQYLLSLSQTQQFVRYTL